MTESFECVVYARYQAPNGSMVCVVKLTQGHYSVWKDHPLSHPSRVEISQHGFLGEALAAYVVQLCQDYGIEPALASVGAA